MRRCNHISLGHIATRPSVPAKQPFASLLQSTPIAMNPTDAVEQLWSDLPGEHHRAFYEFVLEFLSDEFLFQAAITPEETPELNGKLDSVPFYRALRVARRAYCHPCLLPQERVVAGIAGFVRLFTLVYARAKWMAGQPLHADPVDAISIARSFIVAEPLRGLRRVLPSVATTLSCVLFGSDSSEVDAQQVARIQVAAGLAHH